MHINKLLYASDRQVTAEVALCRQSLSHLHSAAVAPGFCSAGLHSDCLHKSFKAMLASPFGRARCVSYLLWEPL